MTSRPLPKRLNELELESDSEDSDFKTPLKRTTKILPRKTSELPTLDSGSEDEQDNLNRGMNLNESFIFTPSKELFDATPLKTNLPKQIDPDVDIVGTSPPASTNEVPLGTNTKSSIFSLSVKTIQENDKNLLNLHRSNRKERDIGQQMSSLAVGSSTLSKPSGTTTTTAVPNSQSDEVLTAKAADNEHLDIINYRPINLKRGPMKSETSSLWKKPELTNSDSGISSPLHLFANKGNLTRDTMSSSREPGQPVFITPGYNKIQKNPPSTRPGTGRLISATSSKKQSTVPDGDLQTRKVLFTTPIGVSCKPVAANTSLSLDYSLSVPSRPKTPATSSHLSTVEENPSSVGSSSGTGGVVASEDGRQIRRIKNYDYVIDKKIGYGGSSTVFLARRMDTGLEVALKVVDLQGDDAIVEGYLNETKLLASLQGNPNVISLFDYYHSAKDSILYMVMEKGETDLQKTLQLYKNDIPLYKLMRYWYEMLLAVDYIHQRGVIHSDLKPANFLMVNGRLKLIDFGIATKINLDATSIVKHLQAGTFNYISPEAVTDVSDDKSSQVPNIKISTKSDVWSLGCILYLLVYKRTPFAHIKNPMYKITAIADPKTEIQYAELPIYYPPFLVKMLKTCLKHNPKERASVQNLLKFPFDMIIPIEKEPSL